MNYAGEAAGKYCLRLRGSDIFPPGFQGQEKIFIAPHLIKDNIHHHTLPNCCMAQWSKVLHVYLPLCVPVSGEIFITPGMNITSRDTYSYFV